MALYNTIVSMCFFIPMVFTYRYHYNIHMSMKLKAADCQKVNDTLHHCNSLIPMFKLLSEIQNSTDVFIESGTYTLNTSYTLEGVQNIRIRSDASNPAIIRCQNNSDLGAGVAFLRVRDLIIEHLNVTGCGMKHSSTSYLDGKRNFISIHSAMFIQNSTNIFITNVNISNSTGIGLLMYDTNGSVNFTESIFANNRLEPNLGGGGIHIEFTECTTGLASCNSRDNSYNKNSKYIIDHCTFEGNTATYAYGSLEIEDFANNHFVTFSTGGGVSVWFNGQAKNNLFKVISSKFISNTASTGGGLHVNSRQNAVNNRVEILWCSFCRK